VILGSASGLRPHGNQLWSQSEVGVSGLQTWGFLGASLTAGDFDADGNADVAIGIGTKDIMGTENSGAVQVMYGNDSGLTATGNRVWYQGGSGILEAPEYRDYFAEEALVAGDFTGDGTSDLVISVPYEDLAAIESAGVIHVLYSTAEIFASGFESGGTGDWSDHSP